MAMAIAASDLPMAAIRAVTVVPIFAPMMKGNSFFGLIFSVDANITAIEVVTEEEWMAAVSPIPLNNDK